MLRVFCITTLLCVAAPAQDKDGAWDLDSAPLSSRAKQLRKQANELWKKAQPTGEKAKRDEPLTPEEITDALDKLEESAWRFQRSLELQWHEAANDALEGVARAWFLLHPKRAPPPKPVDEKAAQKAERARKKAISNLKTDARKLLMKYATAQQYRKQYGRCPSCDGRKDISDPFGGKRACQRCKRKGHLPNRKGIVLAKWTFHGPLYRADVRQRSNMNRTLRASIFDARRLGPYIKKIAIKGKPEFHDTWIRVLVEEHSRPDNETKKLTKEKKYYTLYRVGKTWFLYHRRYDRELVDIPDPPPLEKPKEKKKDTSMD